MPTNPNSNESEDMGYNVPYVPIEHKYNGYTIKELSVRDTQWDCTDPSGRMTYKPSARQYNVIRPDGVHIRQGGNIAPIVVTHYGAALHLVHMDIAEERMLLEELVGPADHVDTLDTEYDLIDRMD